MTMTPRLRKFALTAHVVSSVGLLGAIASFLALAIAGVTSQNAQMVRAAYLAMELIAWFLIVPSAFASLLTGLIQSLGTSWGLFRHYWVLAKLLLKRLCHDRVVSEDGINWLRSRRSGKGDMVRRRSPRRGNPTPGPCCRRSAGVARARGAVGVQAVGQDPVRSS